jgi:hypothetical protein
MKQRMLSFALVALAGPCTAFAQAYFQQQVDHEIHVRLDDVAHTLHARQTVTYRNNSPQTLSEIWFHLWPNAYRDGSSALCRQLLRSGDRSLWYAPHEDRGHIDSLDFAVNGQKARWEYHPDHADICRVILPQPLAPGATISIATPFRVKLPDARFSRLGHSGQAYYITQWFPKPAVYDRDGWHAMPYLTMGEFYNEFGTYDVHITLPANYVVGATGNLQDGAAEMAFMDQRAAETAKKDFSAKPDMRHPASSAQTKTLHYRQDRIHDFAWFADKRYNVMKGSVTVPGTGREVTTWALFTENEGKMWTRGTEYLAEAIRHYSTHVGPYPYDVVTAVDGVIAAGGGMEYPTITIIGESGSDMSLDEVILHEVGHNWFYGILGSNERDHAWMDEGMNSYLESRYMRRRYPQAGLSEFVGDKGIMKLAMRLLGVNHLRYTQVPQLGYRLSARANSDQALEGTSEYFRPMNYGTVVYMKTAAIFNHLEAYLGEAAVDSFLHTYYRQWAFRHPQPDDLRQSLYEATGRHFTWLTDGLINSADKLDIAITDVNEKNGTPSVRLRNMGHLAAPVPVAGMKGDSVLMVKWVEPFESVVHVAMPCPDCDRFMIDPAQVTVDINPKNNLFRRKGAFRNVERLDPRLAGYFERADRSRFALAPLVGGNKYDGVMLGIAAYNDLLPTNRFDYYIAPMFATRSLTLTGQADLGYTYHSRNQDFPDMRIGLAAQRYDAGTWVNRPNTVFRPEVRFTFRPYRRDRPISHMVRLRDNIFVDDQAGFTVAENIIQVDYVYDNRIASFPHSVKAGFQAMNHARFTVEANGFLPYRKGKRNGLGIRLFGGKNFGYTDARYMFRMSGYNGRQDYLYEGTFLGRFEPSGFFAQQMMVADGGFRTYSYVGQSADWLVALNLTSTVYRNVPIVFFASMGTYGAVGAITGGDLFLFELGATLRIVPDVLEVHFPFFTTANITRNTDLITPKYWERIRFTFNLQNFSLRKTVREMFDR